ncbi:hypothetical protein BG011_008802 [Mortierella polycephala]|uniref:Ricin B lectin domain-containing protein n=1 Tax=Mortierella polycephala TaxID=41804 RepID=A0A9P6TX90_9FUNG|nr:hypothetical protein BG011_008802 [Mortierella polycephala]
MNSMRQAAIYLVTILTIINVAMAAVPLIPNGYYRIFTGNIHNPSSNRYFTAKLDARAGSVSLLPESSSPLQVWRLRNHANGQVSLELRAKKKYYLSEGRSGALSGAYVGVTKSQQKWNITKFAGGPFTKYILAHPRRVFNKTLLVSESPDSVDPKYVAFLNEDYPEALQAWKFASAD